MHTKRTAPHPGDLHKVQEDRVKTVCFYFLCLWMNEWFRALILSPTLQLHTPVLVKLPIGNHVISYALLKMVGDWKQLVTLAPLNLDVCSLSFHWPTESEFMGRTERNSCGSVRTGASGSLNGNHSGVTIKCWFTVKTSADMLSSRVFNLHFSFGTAVVSTLELPKMLYFSSFQKCVC